MPRDDAARIRDIVEACQRISARVAQLDRDGFGREDTILRATPYDFAVIGEAAKAISPTVRLQHPEIPWTEMTGMRDVVVHQYFGIDVALVWRAATISVPRVAEVLAQIAL